MNDNVRNLLEKISALEQELATRLHGQGSACATGLSARGSSSPGPSRTRTANRKWALAVGWPQSTAKSVVDSLHLRNERAACFSRRDDQRLPICFPLYGISKVRRSDYMVIDRHHLPT